MKTTFYILATVAIIVALAACTSAPEPVITEIGILHDITGLQLVKPDSQAILSMFDFSDDKRWNGAVFHFSNISDVSYNHFSEVKINTASMWLSNGLERDKEIKNFKNEVFKIITAAGNDIVGKNKSSIYLPIANTLNELAISKAQRRILVIYSDLMENTMDISFYNKKQFQLLTTNSDSIKKQFEHMQALSNLNGIEVNFIYQPTDSQNDKVFAVVSAFYKKLLEDKGAKVSISASITL